MDYDITVIGAGIQGAAVAQVASDKGYRVLLLEQFSEPAMGTSSRSSKLVHGGLRYLESGQFSLVWESLQERRWLVKNYPDLVQLKPFYIPVYQDSTRLAWKIALGLAIYSLFSFKPFRKLSSKHWDTLDGLKQAGLKSVFAYLDAQTDDAALTRAVLDLARGNGAQLEYNASCLSIQVKPEHCIVEYESEGQSASKKIQSIQSRAVVNAAGPWADLLARQIHPNQPHPAVELVQGTHIELPGRLDQGMYYLEAPQDQRAVFVMPWKGHLLVGTTETQYRGDPAQVIPLEDEIQYLLNVYNHYFSGSKNRQDVINAFAGLRVLPKSSGSAFSRPRDTLFIGYPEKSPRVMTLYGGKLTVHRATARKVMNLLDGILAK